MFLNPSMLFFSPVSSHGLVTPVLSMRQPLSNIARDKNRCFLPPFSTVDLTEDQTLLADILATLTSGASTRFYRNYLSEGGLADSRNNWFRHPPLPRQMKSSDMRARANSMDWVLSNSVHCTPFWGTTVCNFCTDMLFITDVLTILDHLASKHKILLSSVFSCPSCLELTLHSWKSFRDHFRSFHNPSLGLLTVFCETAVSLRLSIGFALYTLSSVYEITGLEDSSSMTAEIAAAREPKEYISVSGGYTDLGQTSRDRFDTETRRLGEAILDLRRQLIPDGDLSYNVDNRRNKRTRPVQRTPSCSDESDSDNNSRPCKRESYQSFARFAPSQLQFSSKNTVGARKLISNPFYSEDRGKRIPASSGQTKDKGASLQICYREL